MSNANIALAATKLSEVAELLRVAAKQEESTRKEIVAILENGIPMMPSSPTVESVYGKPLSELKPPEGREHLDGETISAKSVEELRAALDALPGGNKDSK